MRDSPLEQYAEQHSTPEPTLLQELKAFTQANVEMPQMLCGRIEGRLLKWLVGLVQAKRVLELGTYTGYSALSMAEALPDDGTVMSCDRNPQVQAIAKQFIEKSPHGHKIQLIEEDALAWLENLVNQGQTFDFIFIDANKKPYPQYVEYGLKLLAEGGLMAVDNTLFQGQVLEASTDIGKTMDQLNQELAKREELDVLLLPIRDGITLIRRKS